MSLVHTTAVVGFLCSRARILLIVTTPDNTQHNEFDILVTANKGHRSLIGLPLCSAYGYFSVLSSGCSTYSFCQRRRVSTKNSAGCARGIKLKKKLARYIQNLPS